MLILKLVENMSKTPLIDCLNSLNHDRYHMPGHKGIRPYGFPDVFKIDFTEIKQTGNLFLADGPIFDSEQLYCRYFGAKQSIYLTGGSTQGILTAIFTLKPKRMLCDRNSHKALSNALGLCDVEPIFINPDINYEYDIADVINSCNLRQKLAENTNIDAVFITSPNYYGVYSDITLLASICHESNVKLIVDEAHGCHFPAIGIKNAVMCGADISITSAHKTTDSLGQGAVLMSSDKTLNLRQNASIFGTSSPSYAIMASIEMALSNIHNYSNILEKCKEIKNNIEKFTKFSVIRHKNIDTCRLSVNTKLVDITGFELCNLLIEKYNIVPEMSDKYNVVFILTPSDQKLDYLLKCLIEISQTIMNIDAKQGKYDVFEPERAISIREAMFSDGKLLEIDKCDGKISKHIIAPYPPGVPIIYPGEIILRQHIEYITKMCYNDFDKIYIIDKIDK